MAATCIPGMPHSFGGNRRADACDEQPQFSQRQKRGQAMLRRVGFTQIAPFTPLFLPLFFKVI